MLLGLLRRSSARGYVDFRVIVTSATVDAVAMKEFFEPDISGKRKSEHVCVLNVGGLRQHSLDIAYLQNPCRNYVSETVATVLSIHSREPSGDILCFLPSAEEVNKTVSLLEQRLEGEDSHAAQPSMQLLSLPRDAYITTNEGIRYHFAARYT